YTGASWADRHHDFRYLIFHHEHEAALDAALATYEPAVGLALRRERIRLYNAACAIGFLAYRSGVPPDREWCGRTLEGDLKWVRGAMAHLKSVFRQSGCQFGVENATNQESRAAIRFG